jgi:hydroxymethylbilane synthase
LAQARSVARAIETGGGGLQVELVPITTAGDLKAPAGDKSRFVREIEEALLRAEVDLAVHSAKDLPGELPDGLAIVGAPAAADPRDALIGKAASLDGLDEGARVGTSSLRRRSQMLAIRPDLKPVELRGNVDTRLVKLAGGDYDAIVLALAGLARLGRSDEATAVLELDVFVPAAGQGILALEAREDDAAISEIAQRLSDETTMVRLRAERAVTRALETSCHTPVGVHAQPTDGGLRIDAYVGLPDGSEWIRDRVEGAESDPAALGRALAERVVAAGAGEILRRSEAAA